MLCSMLTVPFQGDQEVSRGMGVFGKTRAACADLYHSSNDVVSITSMALIKEVEKFVNLSPWSLYSAHGLGIVFMCCWLRCSHAGGEAIDYILHTSTHSIHLPLIMIYTPFTRDLTIFRLDPAYVTGITGSGRCSLFYMYTSVTFELNPSMVYIKKLS